MALIDSVTDKPWKAENVNRVFGDIRRKCIMDLRARDERNGVTEANGWRVYDDPEGGEPGTSGRYVINPELRRLKHTGEDQKRLLHSRWAEFRSHPRDEQAITADLRGTAREEEIASDIANGKAVEASLCETATVPLPVSTVTLPPIKRGPGRPAGSKNKPQVAESGV